MSDPYTQIARQLPNAVEIGGALITMVEPDPGHERAYNRWYEDDHFYSGAMHGPWTFAGRRFVATRTLRDRRTVVEDSAVQPPDAGCYLSLYWTTRGHEEENERWAYVAMAEALMPHGRGFTHRQHVYTAFHRYRFGVTRGDGPLKPIHALDAPFRGLLTEIVDAPSADRFDELQAWLRDDLLPSHLTRTGAGMVLAFTPAPFTQGLVDDPGTPPVPQPEGLGRRLCLLWFLDHDPAREAGGLPRQHHEALAAKGLGHLRFSGAFVPTQVGTDRYVDELR